MKANHKKFDWLEYLIRFICGAVAGSAIGVGAWLTFGPYSNLIGIITVIGGIVSGGFLAGIWGDNFWDFLKKHGWWLAP